MSEYRIGRWLSAALEDPAVCEEMKADIRDWFKNIEGHSDERRKAIEECAKIADAYAEENLRMAGDSVILDPCLSGHGFSRANVEESKKRMIDGCVHSSMYHAANNVAEAIRALGTYSVSSKHEAP